MSGILMWQLCMHCTACLVGEKRAPFFTGWQAHWRGCSACMAPHHFTAINRHGCYA